jgi:small nuclear ribonucleoprotein (snRNP)-like protein
MNDEVSNNRPDLRPVIRRLREIEKKCASMGTRNEEFPLMQERLASIIKRLEAGEEPSGAPISYRAVARELFPVAHLFESVGFMSVGKEIAHVERTLNDLEPQPEIPPSGATPPRPAGASPAARSAARIEADPETEESGPGEDGANQSRWRVPIPVAIGCLVLLAAIAAATALILGTGPFRVDRADIVVPPTPTETPVPPPTPVPTPTPTPAPLLNTPVPVSRAELAEAVSRARLALSRGDLDAAVERLSEAALLDHRDDDVVAIAEEVIARFVHEANAAVAMAQWQEAETLLERARRIAMRFGVLENEIEILARRHAEMERFEMINPGDTTALRNAIGRRVQVTTGDGSVLNGEIEGIDGANLLLNMDSEIGGGTMKFTEELPLGTIRSIKMFEK